MNHLYNDTNNIITSYLLNTINKYFIPSVTKRINIFCNQVITYELLFQYIINYTFICYLDITRLLLIIYKKKLN